jgi:SAM-dependent methyltransferase
MKRHAPATARNREPLADILREVLPDGGTVLEVASGTGEHAAYFAGLFPHLDWQPSDADPEALDSIEAWVADSGLSNLLPPVLLDAASDSWPVDRAEVILCVNMVHISPWSATVGLMRGAGRVLARGGPLILYGPYRREDVATAASNEAFDRSLRARNPEWGLRRLEDVTAEAEANELRFERLVEMPANNVTAVYRRRPEAGTVYI